MVIRYPRGKTHGNIAALPYAETGKAVIRRESRNEDAPVLWSCGAEVATALEVAEKIDATVVDARYLKPFDAELARKFSRRRQFAIEDHCTSGGLGSALLEALAETPHREVTVFGWAHDAVIPHGEIPLIRAAAGLTAEKIAEKIVNICKNE